MWTWNIHGKCYPASIFQWKVEEPLRSTFLCVSSVCVCMWLRIRKYACICVVVCTVACAGWAPSRGPLAAAPHRVGFGTARSGKLCRARSRLFRSQISEVNMRLKALAEIYTMHSFALLCNLNFLSKKNANIFAKLGKIQQMKIFAKFGNFLANS